MTAGHCECGNLAPAGWRHCRACHAHNDLRVALAYGELGVDEFRLQRGLRYLTRGRRREPLRDLLVKLTNRVWELEHGFARFDSNVDGRMQWLECGLETAESNMKQRLERIESAMELE